MNIVIAAQAVQKMANASDGYVTGATKQLKKELEDIGFPQASTLDKLASMRIQQERWTEALDRISALGANASTVVKMAQILRQMAKEAAEHAMDSTGDSDGFWRAQVEGERLGWAQFYRQATQLADQMVQE